MTGVRGHFLFTLCSSRQWRRLVFPNEKPQIPVKTICGFTCKTVFSHETNGIFFGRRLSPLPPDKIAAPRQSDGRMVIETHALVLRPGSVKEHEVDSLPFFLVRQNESRRQPSARARRSGTAARGSRRSAADNCSTRCSTSSPASHMRPAFAEASPGSGRAHRTRRAGETGGGSGGSAP